MDSETAPTKTLPANGVIVEDSEGLPIVEDAEGLPTEKKKEIEENTVCLRGGDQKKFLFWVNQWFYLVSLVQKIGDPSGAHQFLAFLPIFMAKNCPKKP